MWNGCRAKCSSFLLRVSASHHHRDQFDCPTMKRTTNSSHFYPPFCTGDHTTSLWQLRESSFEHIRTFDGHTRSVKTVAFRRTDPTCFATGGRDNAILIWDTRAKPNLGKADNRITGGHANGPGTPHAYRKSTRQTPKLPPNTSSSSITGLAFQVGQKENPSQKYSTNCFDLSPSHTQDDYTLVSCGGGDGIIKVWDLRRNYTNSKKEPKPKHSIPYPGSSTYQGYSNLLIDSTGQRLYVNCMDHNIYCFNLGVYATQPIITYSGLTNSTFYIKSSLSPDEQYLISGSKDEKAYIWNINSSRPILALLGHADEVTCVAWAKTNELRIVTCSDDSRHKIWRINNDDPDLDTSGEYLGRTERFEPAKQQMHTLKRRLKDLENTPRSLKRIVEVNETTPSSTEKCTTKRSFSDMIGSGNDAAVGGGGGSGNLVNGHQSHYYGGGESKRQLIETRARRLFAPSSAGVAAAAASSTIAGHTNGMTENSHTTSRLCGISEENEILSPKSEESATGTKILLSPLNERNQLSHYRLDEIRTPSTSSSAMANRPTCSYALFSPTSNLPNFVIDGDAPHLKLQSPKRKLKENIDWLTKIRKQKLSTSVSQKLTDKLNDSMAQMDASQHMYSHNDQSQHQHQQQLSHQHHHTTTSATMTTQSETTSGILSPRMRKIKSSDRSSQRRLSSCHSHHNEASVAVPASAASNTQTTTPTRRKSETTLLRYFCVTPTTRSREQSPTSTSNRSNQ